MPPTDKRRIVNSKGTNAITPYLHPPADLEDTAHIIDWIDTLSVRVKDIFKEQQLELDHLETRRQAEVERDELGLKHFDEDFIKLADLVQREAKGNHVENVRMMGPQDEINRHGEDHSDLEPGFSDGDSGSIRTVDSYSDMDQSDSGQEIDGEEIAIHLEQEQEQEEEEDDVEEEEQEDEVKEEHGGHRIQYNLDAGDEEIMILSSEEEQDILYRRDCSSEESDDGGEHMNAVYREAGANTEEEIHEHYARSDYSSAEESDYDNIHDTSENDPVDSSEEEHENDQAWIQPEAGADNGHFPFPQPQTVGDLQPSTGGELDTLISFAQQLVDQSPHSDKGFHTEMISGTAQDGLTSNTDLLRSSGNTENENYGVFNSLIAEGMESEIVGPHRVDEAGIWLDAAQESTDGRHIPDTVSSASPKEDSDIEQKLDSCHTNTSLIASDTDSQPVTNDQETASGIASDLDPELVDELEHEKNVVPSSQFNSPHNDTIDNAGQDVSLADDSSQEGLVLEPSHDHALHYMSPENAESFDEGHEYQQHSQSNLGSHDEEMRDFSHDSLSSAAEITPQTISSLQDAILHDENISLASDQVDRFDEQVLNPPPIFRTLVEQSPEQVLDELKHLEKRFGVVLEVTKELELQLLSERDTSNAPEECNVDSDSKPRAREGFSGLIKSRAMKVLHSLRKALSSDADHDDLPGSNHFRPIMIPVIDAITSSDVLDSCLSESSGIDSEDCRGDTSLVFTEHEESMSMDEPDLFDASLENEEELEEILPSSACEGNSTMGEESPKEGLLVTSDDLKVYDDELDVPQTGGASPDIDDTPINIETASLNPAQSPKIEPVPVIDEINPAFERSISNYQEDTKIDVAVSVENRSQDDEGNFANHERDSASNLEHTSPHFALEVLGESPATVSIENLQDILVPNPHSSVTLLQPLENSGIMDCENSLESDDPQSETFDELLDEVKNTRRSLQDNEKSDYLEEPEELEVKPEGSFLTLDGSENAALSQDGGNLDTMSSSRSQASNEKAKLIADSLRTISESHVTANLAFPHSIPRNGIDERGLVDHPDSSVGEEYDFPVATTKFYDNTSNLSVESDLAEIEAVQTVRASYEISDAEVPLAVEFATEVDEVALTTEFVLDGAYLQEDPEIDTMQKSESLSESSTRDPDRGSILENYATDILRDSKVHEAVSEDEQAFTEDCHKPDKAASLFVEVLSGDEIALELMAIITPTFISEPEAESEAESLPGNLYENTLVETTVIVEELGSDESSVDPLSFENKATLDHLIDLRYQHSLPPILTPLKDAESTETFVFECVDELEEDGSRSQLGAIKRSREDESFDHVEHPLKKLKNALSRFIPRTSSSDSPVAHIPRPELSPIKDDLSDTSEASNCESEDEINYNKDKTNVENDIDSQNDITVIEACSDSNLDDNETSIINDDHRSMREDSSDSNSDDNQMSIRNDDRSSAGDDSTDSYRDETVHFSSDDEPGISKQIKDDQHAALPLTTETVTSAEESAEENDSLVRVNSDEAMEKEASSNETVDGPFERIEEDADIPDQISENLDPSGGAGVADQSEEQSRNQLIANDIDAGLEDGRASETVQAQTPTNVEHNIGESDTVQSEVSSLGSMQLSVANSVTSDAENNTLPTIANSSDIYDPTTSLKNSLKSSPETSQRLLQQPKTVRVLGLDVPEEALQAPRSLRNGHVFGSLDEHPDPPLIMRKTRGKKNGSPRTQGLAPPGSREHPASRTRSKSPMKRSLRQLSSEFEDELAVIKKRSLHSSEQPSSDAESDDENLSSRGSVDSTRGRRRH